MILYIVLPLSIGATAMHASLVISHSSVKGLLEAERVNNFFDDTRGSVNASDLNNNMAAAKASARIDGILSIYSCCWFSSSFLAYVRFGLAWYPRIRTLTSITLNEIVVCAAPEEDATCLLSSGASRATPIKRWVPSQRRLSSL
jgi:hypothetical protein